MEKLIAAGAGIGALALARSEYERRTLSVETFCAESTKIYREKTLVFLSDLHNREFGKDNGRLLEAIGEVNPDFVLCGGDMPTVKGRNRRVGTAISLVAALAKKYPTFCANGNHETRMRLNPEVYGPLYRRYIHALQAAGAVCLENGSVPFDGDINISGVDLDWKFYKKRLFKAQERMPAAYLKRKLKRKALGSGRYEILLMHTPMYFSECAAWGADLTLCGHFHGGTVRLPLLGGLMTPQYQFFLPESAGIFYKGESMMAVSRGLGTHSVNVRLNNLPQVMVIRLKRKAEDGRGDDHI